MKPYDDLSALTLTMMGEARNQGDQGMIDVGQTVLNRDAHPSWRGNTIMQICLKHDQYSCWNGGDENYQYLMDVTPNDPLYLHVREIATRLLAGDIPDETAGATYYKVIGSYAVWAVGKTPCFTRGAHEFYRDIA